MESSPRPAPTAREPFPDEPVPAPTSATTAHRPRRPRVRPIGRIRLPLAGPYRPWARLYRLPDGRLLWTVRLWNVDRAERHLVPTWTLLDFARANRLPAFAAGVRALVRRARERP